MGLTIENVLTSFVLFSVLVTLLYGVDANIRDEYDVSSDYVDDTGKTLIEALKDINVISGFEEVKNAITALYESDESTASEFDILGSLRASAIGVVKISTGILTAPLEIIGVITGFYTIPSTVAVSLGLALMIYLGYMVLRELLGK